MPPGGCSSLDGKSYTLGVLVQSNHGKLEDLTVDGIRLGAGLAVRNLGDTPVDQGSIMMVVATDLPCSTRQLKRIIKRCSVGLARLGSFVGHGSGEIMIGFPPPGASPMRPIRIFWIARRSASGEWTFASGRWRRPRKRLC